jgi:hypothetical protein
MRRRTTIALLFVSLISILVFAPRARAGEVEDQARSLFEKNREAVVTVKLIVNQKMSFGSQGGRDNESKDEVTGTVIGPDGLTVVPLSSTDPTSIIKDMVESMGEGSDSRLNINSDVTSVQILLEDGAEIPASIILRDKQQDLAFVRPKQKPASPMKYIDLKSSETPRVLDQIAVIDRLGEVANRRNALTLDRIKAIVEKPRRYYIPVDTAQGCPAFSLDGKPFGVYVYRMVKNRSGAMGMFSMASAPRNITPVIIPAADILDATQDAPPFGQEPKSDKSEKQPEGKQGKNQDKENKK